MNPAIILWPDVSTCEYEGVPAVKVTADENCGLDLAALFRSHGLTTKGTYPLYVINSREGDVRCILSNTLLGQYKDVPKLFYYYASADNEPQLELATHGHMLTPETIVDLLKVIGIESTLKYSAIVCFGRDVDVDKIIVMFKVAQALLATAANQQHS